MIDLIHSRFPVSQTLMVLSAEAETSSGEDDLDDDGSGSRQISDQMAFEWPGRVVGEKDASNGS